MHRSIRPLVLATLLLITSPLSHAKPVPLDEATPPSAPNPPADAQNLTLGKTFRASIEVKGQSVDSLANPEGGNWWTRYHYPQWAYVDLGENATFNFICIANKYPGALKHFHLQYSNDPDDTKKWTDLAEVTTRQGMLWNGYFPPTSARYVRILVEAPSFDCHFRAFRIYNLKEAPKDPAGQPIPPLAPPTTAPASNTK